MVQFSILYPHKQKVTFFYKTVDYFLQDFLIAVIFRDDSERNPNNEQVNIAEPPNYPECFASQLITIVKYQDNLKAVSLYSK